MMFSYLSQGDPTSELTGPDAAKTGSYFYYFETTSGSTGDTAVLESNVVFPGYTF